MLPGIDITFENGALGSVEPSEDGVVGIIASAVAVSTTFLLGKPYMVTSMTDVAALGIIDDIDNHKLYTKLLNFFEEAQPKKEVWLIGVAKTKKVSEFFTLDADGKSIMGTLLDKANGKINILFTSFDPILPYTMTTTDALDADVATAKGLAQTRLDEYTALKYAPAMILIEGYGYDGDHTSLADLTEESNNRVGIVIGDSNPVDVNDLSVGALVESYAGRLSKIQVQRSVARVKDGPLKVAEIFICNQSPEDANVEAIHNKGYLTFRKITSKAGYFASDSPLATSTSDDYGKIERRRVIDKAFRIAYSVAVDSLNDDFNLNGDGTLSAIDAKTIEGAIENSIFNSMTSNGELSRDVSNANDKGVICKIDLTHNLASTSTLKFAGLQVKVKGIARWINIPLGFVPVSNNN